MERKHIFLALAFSFRLSNKNAKMKNFKKKIVDKAQFVLTFFSNDVLCALFGHMICKCMCSVLRLFDIKLTQHRIATQFSSTNRNIT